MSCQYLWNNKEQFVKVNYYVNPEGPDSKLGTLRMCAKVKDMVWAPKDREFQLGQLSMKQ